MKYFKLLGLSPIAVAALMLLSSNASATTITSPTGTALATGRVIHAESEETAVPGTNHLRLHNAIAAINCSATFSLTLDDTSASGTATGKIDSLTVTCTHPWIAHIELLGQGEVHWVGGYNGTFTKSGVTVTLTHTTTGVKCTYTSYDNLDIGTITGGNPATLHIAVSVPRHGGSLLCGGANAAATGALKTKGAYYIDP